MFRILILDDDPSVRAVCVDLLAPKGHSVMSIGDGETALTILRQRSTDLLITDMEMPGKDGVQVIMAARREFLPLRIIAMSGTRLCADYLRLAANIGADTVLPKPFLPSSLFAAINLVMSDKTSNKVEDHTR